MSEEFFSNEMDEVGTTENNNGPEECASRKQKSENDRTIIAEVIDQVSRAVGSMVRSGDHKAVVAAMRGLLSTLFVMCSLGEYDLGPRVNGELYRYDDYQFPTSLSKLLVAKTVVVRVNPTAKDFLKREIYSQGINSREVLTPSECLVAWKKVCVGLRISAPLERLSRSPEALLADVTQYAVNGRKVPNKDIPTIYFLSQKFDDEAVVPLNEWTRSLAYVISELK